MFLVVWFCKPLMSLSHAFNDFTENIKMITEAEAADSTITETQAKEVSKIISCLFFFFFFFHVATSFFDESVSLSLSSLVLALPIIKMPPFYQSGA